MENAVLDIIIEFLKASKLEKPKHIESLYKNKTYRLYGVDYLLNQLLRQYEIDKSHYLISEKAFEMWNALSDEDISNYYYTKPFVITKNFKRAISLYRGAEKTPYIKKEFSKGDIIEYRQLFHDEHIIPIKIIIDELKNLQSINYDTVTEILDKIYICRMLKEENIKIKEAYKREFDLNKVIEKIYDKYDIKLKNKIGVH